MEAIFLNLVPNGIMPICHASQYDKGREIRCNLREGSTAYTIKSGDVITLKLRKPDNTIVTASITATVGNTYVVFATTEQMCAVVGKNLCELNIKNGSTEIGTANFQMDVERDPIADGDPSESEIHDLDELVVEAVGNNYYTKGATDTLLNAKANASDVYNKTETYTKNEVNNIINNLPEPMIFKGTLGSGGTITSLPAASSSNEGFTYKVITAGTYAGQSAKVGDVFVSNGSSWVLIPSGDTDSDTWRAIKVNGTEKLGNAISSGSVDFTDTTNVKFAFDSSGNKIKATLDGIYTSDETNDLLDGKANTEGEYDDLTVGNAKQLVATVGETDKTPYLFRTAGGSIDIGDRETDELVGGSVAFNQLAPLTNWDTNGSNRFTFTQNNRDFELTVASELNRWDCLNCPITSSIITGHKYLLSAKVKTAISGYEIGMTNTDFLSGYTQAVGEWGQVSRIGISGTSVHYLQIYFGTNYAQYSVGDKMYVSDIQCFDLTQMFGETIADYIYSLEQATAGAGVAWFRRLFNKPYYAYNAGELMSVKTSGHKLVGFNQFDKNGLDLAQGGFDYKNPYNTTNVTTYNYMPVISNTVYCWHSECQQEGRYIRYYDSAQELIGSATFYTNDDIIFTTPENARYIRVMWFNTAGLTVDQVKNGNVNINISWDGERNGEYEPYEVNTYPLDSDLELRGIPKLDADNKLYFDGDTYSSDGSVSRRYRKLIINGQSDLNYQPNGTTATTSNCYIPMPDKKFGRYNFMATRFIISRGSAAPYAMTGRDATNGIEFYLPTDIAQTSSALKQWFTDNPITVLYEVDEPTTEQAEPFTNPQIVNDFGTEEYIDNRAVAIPVGHETVYQPNLRAKLEMSPDSPESNGDYLMRHTSEGNSYTPYINPIPALPSTNGNYVLKCTVSGSTKTLTWVEQT